MIQSRQLYTCLLEQLKSAYSKKGVKRIVDGPPTNLIEKVKEDKTAYRVKELVRNIMGLTDSCRMCGMNCFKDISKVDIHKSTWNPEICEVSNK